MPVLSRSCKGSASRIRHWETGKVGNARRTKPEDLSMELYVLLAEDKRTAR